MSRLREASAPASPGPLGPIEQALVALVLNLTEKIRGILAAERAKTNRPRMPVRVEDQAMREAIDRARAGELLGGKELGAIFQVKHAQFHNLMKTGAFDQFLVTPAIGRKRYSGIKVYRYLCGDPSYEPTFGRKRRAS